MTHRGLWYRYHRPASPGGSTVLPDAVADTGVELIQNEVKMLGHIQKYISIPIPEPIYISLDPGCPVMGYEKIKGIPLSKCFDQTSKTEKIRISKEIGEFLSDLHSDELLEAALENQIVEINFSCEKYRKDWHKYYDKIQETIYSMMNSVQIKWISNLFNTFLGEKENPPPISTTSRPW